MRMTDGGLRCSPTDLAKFIGCEHLVRQELGAARGQLKRAYRKDATLEVLTQKGLEHEQRYVERLRGEGKAVVEVTLDFAASDGWEKAAAVPLAAMRAGADVVYQATFVDGGWRGRAD